MLTEEAAGRARSMLAARRKVVRLPDRENLRRVGPESLLDPVADPAGAPDSGHGLPTRTLLHRPDCTTVLRAQVLDGIPRENVRVVAGMFGVPGSLKDRHERVPTTVQCCADLVAHGHRLNAPQKLRPV